jgi:hypothetical protein
LAVTGEDDVVGDVVVVEDGVPSRDERAGRGRDTGKVGRVVVVKNFKVVEDIAESSRVESKQFGFL